MTKTAPNFDALDPLLPNLADFYRDVHQHPELSSQEHRTAEAVAREVKALGAYEVTTGVGGTGVVAVLDNGPGPTVLLRADFDALPIEEATGLPYTSVHKGVMHACGHDMHATCLLGGLHLLAESRNTWSGKVIAVFQPAEETGQGAQAMIDDNFFDRFGTPDIVLAQHSAPGPVGMVGMHPGTAEAATDAWRVVLRGRGGVLRGRGGHGAMPQLTVDPVVMAAATITRLQTVVSREIAATDAAVVTVGAIHGGSKDSIIPDEVELKVNIRTFTPEVREKVLAAVERIIKAEAAAAGAPTEPEISVIDTFPVLVNDPDAIARTAAAFRDTLGIPVLDPGPQPGSEDAGHFATAAEAPLCYWHFGALDPKLFGDAAADPDTFRSAFAAGRIDPTKIPATHTPYYAPVVEPAITVGVKAMTTAALTWLGH
ncbi:amidohydrolase [Nocardia sp. NPDC006044]|uniref:amidohydrolase n=1 Tax=Nocardia sp. NPDC006044 TaxID=3364306 RepID=UPI003675FDD1